MPRTDNSRNVDFPQTPREISWTAIIAGALVALSLSFLIHSLNAGLGLSAFTTSPTGMMVLAIGVMFWYLITTVVVMFIAGWVAGRLARRFRNGGFSGVLHGFLAWSLALVVGLALAVGVLGGIVGSYEEASKMTTHLTAQASSESSTALVPSKKTENVAATAGATALAAFFIFLFGAAAAGAGGYYGATDRNFRFNERS